MSVPLCFGAMGVQVPPSNLCASIWMSGFWTTNLLPKSATIYLFRYVHPVGILERYGALSCLLNYLFVDGRIERQMATEHKVHNNSKAEHIDAFIILFQIKYFRSNIARSSSVLLFRIQRFQIAFVYSKAKIYQFYSIHNIFFFVCNDHHIFRFQITMNQP